MDNKLKKLEDVYKITQEWDDSTDFYDPEYPSIMSTINLIARLEWTRRKLLEFNIPTVNAFHLDFDDNYNSSEVSFKDITLPDIMSDEIDNIYECCLFCNTFDEYLSKMLEQFGWKFISFCDDEAAFMKVISPVLETKDIEDFKIQVEDAFVVQAPDIISTIYKTITSSDALKNEPAAVKFMEYIPQWMSTYYSNNFFSFDESNHFINGKYTCGNVLCLFDSVCPLGYEVQCVSLPFRIMLTNYYANILVTSFPQLFGIDTEEVMYG